MKMDDWEIKKWMRRKISLDHNYHKNCNIFSCPKCSTKVRSKEALKEHIERYSDLENCKLTKNIKCKDCQRLYLDVGGFFSHKKDGRCKAVQPREQLICEVCGKMGFKYQSTLKLHVRSHTEDVICKKCGAKFSHFSNLRRHELHICLGDKVCDVCGKKGFSNKIEFSKHMQKHDETFKLESMNLDFKCGNCGSGFSCQSNVNNHLKHSCGHGICEHCGKADFKTKMEFRKHLNNDHNSSSLIEPDLQGQICHICFRSFNSRTAKDKHISSVHKGFNNPATGNIDYFTCDRCGEVVTSIEELQSHKKALHSRYDKIPCKVCEKLIVGRKMREHMRVHSDERNFKCESCGKNFKWSSHLRYHRKKQNCSGDTPHKTNKTIET